MTIDGKNYRALRAHEIISPGDLERVTPLTRAAQYRPVTLFEDPITKEPLRPGIMGAGWHYLREVSNDHDNL